MVLKSLLGLPFILLSIMIFFDTLIYITIRALLIFTIRDQSRLSSIILLQHSPKVNSHLKLEGNLHSLLILEQDRLYPNVKRQINPYYKRKLSPNVVLTLRLELMRPMMGFEPIGIHYHNFTSWKHVMKQKN